MRGKPRAAQLGAAQPVAAAETGLLARADRAQLDPAAQAARELLLHPSGLDPPLGAVREDETGAVEHELGRDRLHGQTVCADHLAERGHRLLRLLPVSPYLLFVVLVGPPNDPLQAPGLPVGNRLPRLHDAAELASP